MAARGDRASSGSSPSTAGAAGAGWATGIGIAEAVDEAAPSDEPSNGVEFGLLRDGWVGEAVSVAVDRGTRGDVESGPS